VVPPTYTNVSLDPITDVGHRARCPYRRGHKAATRDGENARPRYAYSSYDDVATVPLGERERRRPLAADAGGPVRSRDRRASTTAWPADQSSRGIDRRCPAVAVGLGRSARD
jgi:hypothetical protein